MKKGTNEDRPEMKNFLLLQNRRINQFRNPSLGLVLCDLRALCGESDF
jgi:hypothetical protein